MSDRFLLAAPTDRDHPGVHWHAAPKPIRSKVPEAENATIRDLLPLFVAYAEYEWHLGPRTIRHYRDTILRVLKVVGDIKPADLDLRMVLLLKADLANAHVGANWTRSVVNGLRSFLRFSRLVLNLDVLDPKAIRLPPIPRREVVYLTSEEIEIFLNSIPVFRDGGRVNLNWLCFRALVETLLATGMRISEALSLNRNSVNFQTGEARIIGKGRKERTVFFTPRAFGWLKEYANHRSDSSDQLFTLSNGQLLEYDTVRVWFKKVRQRTGIQKPITAHIMRHTCATLLLFNGCPIGHIKEILGHDRLETTCRYYLGVDKAAAKEAHHRYLKF
jgi:integrase/recombinase XerD